MLDKAVQDLTTFMACCEPLYLCQLKAVTCCHCHSHCCCQSREELPLPPLLLLLLELLAGAAALRRVNAGLSWRTRFARLAGSSARRASRSGERDAPRRCGRLLR